MTANDLISAALRLIGALATGESTSAAEANDALFALNEMLDAWATESLLVFAKIIEIFPLVGGQQVYTMGVSGTFNTARAQKIERAGLQVLGSSPTNELPIELINMDQWAAIAVKSTTSTIPTRLYNDGANPLDNLYLWPVPTAANNIVLYSWKPLLQIASLKTEIVFPPGYAKALRFNLALSLCPEYGKQPDQAMVADALESKANIKRMNSKMIYMAVDSAISAHRQGFNWITGE